MSFVCPHRQEVATDLKMTWVALSLTEHKQLLNCALKGRIHSGWLASSKRQQQASHLDNAHQAKDGQGMDRLKKGPDSKWCLFHSLCRFDEFLQHSRFCSRFQHLHKQIAAECDQATSRHVEDDVYCGEVGDDVLWLLFRKGNKGAEGSGDSCINHCNRKSLLRNYIIYNDIAFSCQSITILFTYTIVDINRGTWYKKKGTY